MTHAPTLAPDSQYRRYYAMVFDGSQSYEEWLRTNQLAFNVLNPNIGAEQEAAAFRFWMIETYEGQFFLA